MRWLLLAAIRAYQRHLSPRKGYCCAYRAHTGRASCSTLGYRAVRRHGVLIGLLLIRRRTWLCGVAHRRYGAIARPAWRAPQQQRGFCDAGCDPGCDLGVDDLCDISDLCDCGNDKRQRRKSREQEKYVRIPPQVKWPRPAGEEGRKDKGPRGPRP